MKLELDLPTDVSIALRRFANEEKQSFEEAAISPAERQADRAGSAGGRRMNEADRMRNIVKSYLRDGLTKGEAVRAATDCVERLEKQKAELIQRRARESAQTEAQITALARRLFREDGNSLEAWAAVDESVRLYWRREALARTLLAARECEQPPRRDPHR